MDKLITKSDDLASIYYGVGNFRKITYRLRQSLTDDFALALHCRTKHLILQIVIQMLSLKERLNRPCSLLNIPQVCPPITPHRVSSGLPQSLVSDTDYARHVRQSDRLVVKKAATDLQRA